MLIDLGAFSFYSVIRDHRMKSGIKVRATKTAAAATMSSKLQESQEDEIPAERGSAAKVLNPVLDNN